MRERQSDQILKDNECREIVRKKLDQESLSQYELVSYEVVPLSASYGFMGQYFKLRAKVVGPRDSANLEFFAKVPPSETSPQHEFNLEMGSFRKEVALYTDVFPELLAGLQRGCVPECFLGRKDASAIVLEDMSRSGFGMTDKHLPFDYEHCAVMMRTLARFHARSIVFEEFARKSLHDLFAHCMHETLWPLTGKRATTMFQAAVKGSISLVDMVSELSEEQRRRLKEKIANLSKDHAYKLLPSKTFKNVLCHGDLWANNILFKYDADGKPTACCLIDFQLARYNPPAHDILCFLQFSTTRQLRAERLNELLRVYYESLSATLREAQLDCERVYSWEELSRSVEELRLVCMLHGVLNTPVMLLDEATVNKYFVDEPERLEQVIYVDRTPLVCQTFRDVSAYRERMRDALLELHDCIFP